MMSVRFCSILVLLLLTHSPPVQSSPPLLLLISCDGFRWDYLDILGSHRTPNFHKLLSGGVRATWVNNVVPTVTMPNHMSIVSGLYAESHGAVSNSMYDKGLNETYIAWKEAKNGTTINGDDGNLEKNTRWFGKSIEPIWYLNEVAGTTRRSGVHSWPGTPIRVKNVLPSQYIAWYAMGPKQWPSRIDTVIGWFTDKNQPINFAELYFEEPDETGHAHGPDSEKTHAIIMELDKAMGYLVSRLKAVGLFDRMNIIITSDHGMATVFPQNCVEFPLSRDSYDFYDGFSILPKKGQEKKVYEILKNLDPKHLWVYYKNASVPTRYHYSHNERIQPIVLFGAEGYRWAWPPNSTCHNISNETFFWGNHGYPPYYHAMHPFFIAHGPAFKRGVWSAPFETVDIYSAMAHILGVTPGKNNGSFGRIRHILSDNGGFDIRCATGGVSREFAGSMRLNILCMQPRSYLVDIVLMVLVVLAIVLIFMGYHRILRRLLLKHSQYTPVETSEKSPDDLEF